MRHTKLVLATMAMAVLAACGGTSPSPGNQTPKIHYTAQVTFGDSLSDVGSYAGRDVPNGTAQAQRLKPDGLPIRDPRPEPYATDASKVLGTEAGVPLATEAGSILIIDDVVP